MSIIPFVKTATKSIRSACVTFKLRFKTVKRFNSNSRDFRLLGKNPNPTQSKSRLEETSLYFHYFTKRSKYSLIFSFGCIISGTFGLVTYCIKKLSPTVDLETLSNIFVNSVEAKSYFSRHNFIADVVDKTGPAVTFLEIKGNHPDSGRRITLSNGSGFLVRPNGLILTSAHVVTNKSRVVVKLHNEDIYEGRVTAVDPVYDLATVKIEAKGNLPFIPLESSSKIRPGEFVVAMGSPLSLTKTVTSGIISSSLRASEEIGLDNKKMQYIQTDAVINAGNSGGPLVNLDGKAIGINNLKIRNGISFAIPADYAFEFLKEAERIIEKAKNSSKPSYIADGKESTNKRRFMGIAMLSLTPQLIDELKEGRSDFPSVDNGVYVHTVLVGSPAYDGGLHAGDIILEINSGKINSTADIYQCVEKDTRLRIKIVRGKHEQILEVVTEELF